MRLPPPARASHGCAAPILAALVATLGVWATASAGPRPGPVPHHDDPESCAGCHARQVAEWRASPHAKAAASEGFLASLRRYGAAPAVVAGRCLACHTPRAADPGAAAAGLLAGAPVAGVVCSACHGGSPAAHPTRYQPGVAPSAAAEACAGCHRWEPPAVACSTVYDGWRASPAAAAGISCQGCHMPDGAHRFEGSRSPAMLRRAATVAVSAEAGPEGPVALVEVRNLAGHRLPDG
jgi:hypothetical protein